MKFTKTGKRVGIIVTMALLCGSIVGSQLSTCFGAAQERKDVSEQSLVKKIDDKDLNHSRAEFYDPEKVFRLPENVSANREISVIVTHNTETLLDGYRKASAAMGVDSVSEYLSTREGKRLSGRIGDKNAVLMQTIRNSGISYKFGESYNVILSGFEVIVKAKDLNALENALGKSADVIVGEEYAPCESQIVTNEVEIDESTGIFDSSKSQYDGSGTTVAVLDTGLDYVHSAFDPSRFEGEEVITLESLAPKISSLAAARMTAGLKAEDVYMNKKVPYGYDYADGDDDVAPLSNEHGTHVSGVIVGNDDMIRGVAPNAQLLSMKVFSDVTEGARSSWILAALQDCVTLGVDVINMSLGTSAGFSNAQDDERIEKVYNSIRDAGISLICAASNDYSSAYGSEKNGNNGLTSNPSTGTVGSPSTLPAALSVASVSGKKTPYLMFGDRVIYFDEANNQASKPKDFVGELLASGVSEGEVGYVAVAGVGRNADYSGIDVNGKIALVRRGSNTFEEKVKIAEQHGAIGVIIYNNVSGKILMTVGRANIPACSISQDDGRALAAKGTGTIKISATQVAGPYMSDFSSWGPTEDLKIKPEITAHGGEILSAVPGQKYDRMSGTSMASPNQAGVTALVRQYVKDNFEGLTPLEVTARVNQLMMSTADIVYNMIGLPYAVRKQGAGLANLTKATSTPAYLSTFDADGSEMDKTKLELGDDKNKSGVYEMKFAINNISNASLSYDVGGVVLTEGVNESLTARGDTTVTEEGYKLGADVTVQSVGEGGSQSGNTVTVAAKSSVIVTVRVTLTAEDKEYLDRSFANGMYVEGFITCTANGENKINLSVPYLAFYGDWNRAPIFDLDYFETDADDKNAAIDPDEKIMADAYPTAPIGGLYEDYIVYLGSYAYLQDPSVTQISANREHIALTNQTGESGGVNSLYQIWAGMLRAADRVEMTITEEATGKVVFERTEYNQRKSLQSGGSIYMSPIDVDFDINETLKNNTRYHVFTKAYTPYGDGGSENNLRNTFEFTFTTDFEAPAVTGCEFYTEYDATQKKTRLFAKLAIYDNHYSQAVMVGTVTEAEPGTYPPYILTSFDRYLNPLYSDFNSTYYFTYELTDHLDEIRNSYTKNAFIVSVNDYALNEAIYEITIPDDVTVIKDFINASGDPVESLTLSPNEVYQIAVDVMPATSWADSVTLTSSDESVLGIVNGKLVARSSGTATVTATANRDPSVFKKLQVTVLSPDDPACVKYDKPVADSFRLTGYYVDKAYYFGSSEDRDLGEIGATMLFKGNSYALSFYPSETVTLQYDLDAYFPDPEVTKVVYSSSNSSVVTVDENGTITAQAEGNASVTAVVYMDGKRTYYSNSVRITVKNPYTTNGFMLTSYKGLGGEVIVPDDLGITEIFSYAFSNYHYIPKDENDEISEEDPTNTKIAPIGENTITKVVLPEGVTVIDSYAFCNLTALEEIVLPSTCNKIQAGAFDGCTKLRNINLENVQFINQKAFRNCPLGDIDLSSVVAIGNSAFEMQQGVEDADGKTVSSELGAVNLPATAQSLGESAFRNSAVSEVTFAAESVKLGSFVFAECSALTSITVNAAVIPAYAFINSGLTNVSLGKDVAVIGEYAFAGSKVTRFEVDGENKSIKASGNNQYITDVAGTTLVMASPLASSFDNTTITEIGDGAFVGNVNTSRLETVNLPNVTKVGNFAFAECVKLKTLTLGTLTEIGEFAFADCKMLPATPSLSAVKNIGAYAFAGCEKITSVEIGENVTIGEGAFTECIALNSVTVGNGSAIGFGAFCARVGQTEHVLGTEQGYILFTIMPVCTTVLKTVTLGNNVTVGPYAFYGNDQLETVTLGSGAEIGEYAFYLCSKLKSIDLAAANSIGAYAFAAHMMSIYGKSNSIGDDTIVSFDAYDMVATELASIGTSLKAETIGECAFLNNKNLTAVTFEDTVKTIGGMAFFGCEKLASANLDKIETFGMGAFFGTVLTSVDLSSAKEIGESAFEGVATLTTVTLGTNPVAIGAYAFASDTALESIDLGNVTKIGESAFEGDTKLKTADLTSVTDLGNFAFRLSGVESVTFGDKIETVGDNPFAQTPMAKFEREGDTSFEVNEKVFVENGVLYAVVPNGGYELISYPAQKEDIVFSVKEGTVRLSAQSFAFNPYLVSVTLPYELKSIGDKAFYQCDALRVVVFNSVSAPILEELFDLNYVDYDKHPQTGEIVEGVQGLGIVPYYMWSMNETVFYYGANFVNYVGQQTQPLIMVSPANGENYSAFVISKYFTARTDGKVAPYTETLEAIAAIDALPDYITLDNEAQVQAARAKYNAIVLTEQQALVTNYNKLASAESTIKYLHSLDDTRPDIEEPKPLAEKNGTLIAMIVLFAVFAAASVALATFWALEHKGVLVLGKKKEGEGTHEEPKENTNETNQTSDDEHEE